MTNEKDREDVEKIEYSGKDWVIAELIIESFNRGSLPLAASKVRAARAEAVQAERERCAKEVDDIMVELGHGPLRRHRMRTAILSDDQEANRG